MKGCLFLLLSFVVMASGCRKKTDTTSPGAEWDFEDPDGGTPVANMCNGRQQSPININTREAIKAQIPPLIFNYNPFNLKIIDDGHTIEVINNGINKINVDGEEFEFRQSHFHHTSEHAIDGAKTEMELHLVHQNPVNKTILVIGLMLKEGPENNTIEKIFNNIPPTKRQEVTTSTSIDINDLLPVDKNYFTYAGSLTTVPCTESLTWVVMKQPVTLSRAQIKKFTQLYMNNSRSLQPLNNRFVLQSMN